MRLRSVSTRTCLVAVALMATVLVSVPAALWREGPGALIPGLDDRSAYAEIVPQKLLPLKSNRPWNPDWERWPVTNVPRHPLDILTSSSRAEPALQRWVEEWQDRVWQGEQVHPEQRAELAKLLEGSGLSAIALLEAGQSFDLAGDDATAAMWFRHGAMRGERELAELPKTGDLRGQRLAEMLIGIQGVMWEAQNAGRMNEGCTLECMFRILVGVLRRDDEQRGWAQIGIADALNLQQRYAEALSYAQSCDMTRMDSDQRVGLAWAKGMALQGQDRYTESIAYLREAVGSSTFAHRGDARALLVMALVRTDDVAAAQRECEPFEHGDAHSVLSAQAVLMVRGALRAAEPPGSAGGLPVAVSAISVMPASLVMYAVAGQEVRARVRVDRRASDVQAQIVHDETDSFALRSVEDATEGGTPAAIISITYIRRMDTAAPQRARLRIVSGGDSREMPVLGLAGRGGGT